MDDFSFDVWFDSIWETYRNAKDLFHAQQGGKTGAWRTKLQKDLNKPDLYPRFNGQATLADNCLEVSERLRSDIKIKRKKRDAGEPKTSWHLPMFSVYFGQGDGGRRYTWELETISNIVAKPKTEISQSWLTDYVKPYTDRALAYCIKQGIIVRGQTTRAEMHYNCMKYMHKTGLAPKWVDRRLHGQKTK